MAIPDHWNDAVYIRSNALGWEIVSSEDDSRLVTVTKIDTNAQVENSDYSYKMRFGTNTWHVKFDSKTDVADVRYITANTQVFD